MTKITDIRNEPVYGVTRPWESHDWRKVLKWRFEMEKALEALDKLEHKRDGLLFGARAYMPIFTPEAL